MTLHNLLSRNNLRTLSERQQRIYSFLDEKHVGLLSTVTPNGDPHGSVIYYILDEDFTIHILTKSGTRKHDNLLHNNHVMVTVFDSKTQTTVQILGVATEQNSSPEVNKVINRIFRRMMDANDNQLPPIVKLQAGKFVAFTIKPVQIRMAVFARPDAGDYGELFDSIESFELYNKV